MSVNESADTPVSAARPAESSSTGRSLAASSASAPFPFAAVGAAPTATTRLAREAFSRFHPAVNFLFFGAAIVLGMCLRHPAFLACSVVFSFAYYVVLRGRSSVKMLIGMVALMLAVTVINPLINTMGNTVLFTCFGDRPYTLESMIYGLAIGAMFVSVFVWFGCYHASMTSDKFTFLFGSLTPSTSQLFTMVLRLIPSYQRKMTEIGIARACTGKGVGAGSIAERASQSSAIISALASWALENGVVLADSMKSRGYGTGKRTAFALWHFTARDAVLAGIIVVLLVAVFVSVSQGAAWVNYVPDVEFTSGTVVFAMGITAYALLLAIPLIVDIRESLIWRISLSKI